MRNRAERDQFAARQKHPAEERIRHRHQRQHVDLSRHVVADPLLGVRVERRGRRRAVETRLALDEAEIILVGPRHRRVRKRARLFERRGAGKGRLLVRPGRTALGEYRGRQRRDVAAALRHLHAPMLARAVGLDQADVEIERRLPRPARRNSRSATADRPPAADGRSAPAGWWPPCSRRTGRQRPSNPGWSCPASSCRRR